MMAAALTLLTLAAVLGLILVFMRLEDGRWPWDDSPPV